MWTSIVVENGRTWRWWWWYSGKRIRRGPNQVKKINRLKRGMSLGEERMRLIKCHIMRNSNVTSNLVPTTISLTLRVITKENTPD
jgi:hypothetical protein